MVGVLLDNATIAYCGTDPRGCAARMTPGMRPSSATRSVFVNAVRLAAIAPRLDQSIWADRPPRRHRHRHEAKPDRCGWTERGG
jgi:hypothetical protein